MKINLSSSFKGLVFGLKLPPRILDEHISKKEHQKERAKILNNNKRAIAKVNKAARSLYIQELRELKCRK